MKRIFMDRSTNETWTSKKGMEEFRRQRNTLENGYHQRIDRLCRIEIENRMDKLS